ncbi:M61 family metallopeptidase [Flavilitoribacter nigricans]|uniref:Peptidase M61 n=1 Tax=Flavilitoribacter nigricans (strain ATCC 23147 / DSM 23189 / NBRC 102662 / NCIMB 1420 / SS-2) TaxID=1122177 RepID=A0A2D0N0T7_FLAN2|nr:PDZ domain-containing protein [Flavilitoribacter nigricans]PHN02105.1 peptidase M61 [Flavilitoribacter nigricans DSM 23189 = NBRC 102662]
MIYHLRHFFSVIIFNFLLMAIGHAQPEGLKLHFSVAMDDPAAQLFQVQMVCEGLDTGYTDLKIPVWMPGYYQVLNYPEKIQNFRVMEDNGQAIRWEKANRVTWRVYHGVETSLTVAYEVLADRPFVATNFLSEERAYLAPGGIFMHLAGKIDQPATITIIPNRDGEAVATGLETVDNNPLHFYAPDFDVLYDSPLLVGPLDTLPSFEVRGVPHRFVGYQLGDFDHQTFMDDLKQVVEAAVDMIGDIPFEAYTFIGIGPGAGGIEHLNSTMVSFSGSERLNTFEGRKGVLSFLGHEYFHHYNAKRIRPIELGPFDYDHGSRTNMLWVAEGITAYYDELLLRRAGLVAGEDIIKTFERTIRSVESSPGSRFQSVTQASFDTWSDGPFGRKNDELNKTVSYYEKGPILGLLLDLKIRQETSNKRSLDDVMRSLYFDIYKKEGRGYTEEEFRAICEKTAGVPLHEFFSYVYSVQPIDYAKYLGYAGLKIDLEPRIQPGAYLGIRVAEKEGKLIINQVEWNSPAWYEGLRRDQEIIGINGQPASAALLEEQLMNSSPGEILRFEMKLADGSTRMVPLLLEEKKEISFAIERVISPSAQQQAILDGWLGTNH